jgi:hypothetical protein
VLGYDHEDGTFVRAHEHADRYELDFSGNVRFVVSRDLGTVDVWAHDEGGWSLAPVLLEGWVLAFVLQMAGRGVLHASAVALGDRALALVGDSGSGKSTIATVLCSRGARFIADDVLNVVAADGLCALPGSAATRLRPAAFSLARQLPSAPTHHTGDGRLSVSFADRVAQGPVPLGAVLVPWPDRRTRTLSITWLDPRLAVAELCAHPRLYEWRVAGPRRQEFEWASDIAQAVPVGHLVVPWAEWSGDAADELTDHLLHALREGRHDDAPAPFERLRRP